MSEQATDLTVEQKLALLNGLHITEWDVYGEGGGYVTVPVNEESRAVLQQLGYDERYITENQAETSDGEAEIDIWTIACDCGAEWFAPSSGGFSVEKPVVGA